MPASAEITLFGSFAETGRGHGTDRALVAGLLGFATDDVRIKNSLEFADDAGMHAEIRFSRETPAHPNTAKIEAVCRDGRHVELTGVSVGGGSIEVREVNGMEVSFGCEYPTLLIFHKDRPGAIYAVTGSISRADINIAFMRVFRSSKFENACMVIEVDGEIPDRLVDEVTNCDSGITGVYTL